MQILTSSIDRGLKEEEEEEMLMMRVSLRLLFSRAQSGSGALEQWRQSMAMDQIIRRSSSSLYA